MHALGLGHVGAGPHARTRARLGQARTSGGSCIADPSSGRAHAGSGSRTVGSRTRIVPACSGASRRSSSHRRRRASGGVTDPWRSVRVAEPASDRARTSGSVRAAGSRTDGGPRVRRGCRPAAVRRWGRRPNQRGRGISRGAGVADGKRVKKTKK